MTEAGLNRQLSRDLVQEQEAIAGLWPMRNAPWGGGAVRTLIREAVQTARDLTEALAFDGSVVDFFEFAGAVA